MLTRNKRRIDDYLVIDGKYFKIQLNFSAHISNIERLTGNDSSSINSSLNGIVENLVENSETAEQQNPQKKRRLTKIPRLLQSNYFTIESNVNGKVIVKCLTCGEVRKGDISSTGNFLSHIKRKHPTLMPNVTAFLNDESHGELKRQNTITAHLEPVSKEEVRSFLVVEVS